MVVESAVTPKYKRGQHPNSRANLKAPWQPGMAPNPNPGLGLRIKPALQRFSDMTVEDFKKLDLKKCTVAEMVALQSLQKAAFDAEFGDRMRIFVTERMDGAEDKNGGPTVQVNTQVNVNW